MFKISEFSKLSGLSIDTLYHYEKMNLLIPYKVDKLNNYRYYDASQLLTVNKIIALKDAGFSLDEISHIFQKELPITSLIDLLAKKALVIEDNLNKETDRLRRLYTNIFLIKNGGIPLMNEITVKSVEPILVASRRKLINKNDFDSSLEVMWPEVNGYIDANGGKRTIPCLMLYHSGWWPLDNSADIDVEVVEPVIKTFKGNESISVYELPKLEKAACIVHLGSFGTISESSDALLEWIKQNGYAVAGPVREIYHKGDWATDDPDEYVTELQIPVKYTEHR